MYFKRWARGNTQTLYRLRCSKSLRWTACYTFEWSCFSWLIKWKYLVPPVGEQSGNSALVIHRITYLCRVHYLILIIVIMRKGQSRKTRDDMFFLFLSNCAIECASWNQHILFHNAPIPEISNMMPSLGTLRHVFCSHYTVQTRNELFHIPYKHTYVHDEGDGSRSYLLYSVSCKAVGKNGFLLI